MLRSAMIVTMLAATPLAAEEPPATADDGFSLMEEGAKLVLRGLMSEMEPALDAMGEAVAEMEPHLRDMGPWLSNLAQMMGDATNYAAPEMLENGDILIRRKTPLPPAPVAPQGEIEL